MTDPERSLVNTPLSGAGGCAKGPGACPACLQAERERASVFVCIYLLFLFTKEERPCLWFIFNGWRLLICLDSSVKWRGWFFTLRLKILSLAYSLSLTLSLFLSLSFPYNLPSPSPLSFSRPITDHLSVVSFHRLEWVLLRCHAPRAAISMSSQRVFCHLYTAIQNTSLDTLLQHSSSEKKLAAQKHLICFMCA